MGFDPQFVIAVAMIAVYARVAFTDYSGYRIENGAVLSLLAIYFVGQALTGFDTLWPDLATGAALFAATFVMWMLGMIGAGDVKLLGVTGAIVGTGQVLLFAVLVLAFSLAFLVGLLLTRRVLEFPVGIPRRVQEFAARNKVPYGVPLAAAAIIVLVLRSAAPGS